jgi:ribonuclease D
MLFIVQNQSFSQCCLLLQTSKAVSIVYCYNPVCQSVLFIVKKPLFLTTQQDATVDAMMALLRKFCDEQAIAPTAVASRKDIERVVSGDQSVNILQGWRNEIVGHHLNAFLNGDLTLSVNQSHLITEQKG